MKFSIKAIFIVAIWVAGSVSVFGQITNDTTQMLYGPKTTRIFYERNFFRGNYSEVPVDTSLTNTYNPLFWFSDTTFQQTLGNVGLATKPLLFQFPEKIGARLGRNAFDYYAYRPENIAYLDTRSPYTKLNFVQGSLGEGVFEAEFSRNIRKWWNAGIAYKRITANKQIGATRSKDQQVDGNNVKFYMHLQTNNNRYHLFANYVHMNHKFVESGGVKPKAGDGPEDLFGFASEDINLRQATGRDIRHSFHIGQTYALFGEKLKLFYDLDQRKQRNRFDDAGLTYTTVAAGKKVLDFYPNKISYDSTSTHDRSVYTELENTGGITGNQKHYFYKAYLKNRYATVSRLTYNEQTFNQTFVGGEAELKINEKIKTAFRTEYKLTDEYFAQAEIRFLFLGAEQTRISFSPTIMQQNYNGNSYEWHNNFDNTTADRTALWIEGKLWHNTFRAELANISLNNYVFYNQQQLPQQVSAVQRLQTAVINHKLEYGKLRWRNLVTYTNTGSAPYIRIPDWVINSKLYYEGFLWKKALFGQVGLETTFRSAYLADSYSPALQQFYLQDNFKLDNYPVADVFLAADIKSVSIFLKVGHVNEKLLAPGYFTTPYYPGMRLSFIYGVKWQFFD